VGERIRAAREKAELTQQAIATHLGISRAAVAQWETDVTSPSIATVHDLARFLPGEVTAQWLAYGVSDKPIIVEKVPDGTVALREVVFGNKVDEMQDAGAWSVPTSYLKGDLHVMSTEGLIIWRAESVAMSPTYEYGDRVIVDTNAKRVSPPGVFLIWDGVGPSLAQIGVTQTGDAKHTMVRVATSTKPNESYETQADKLHIIGRVRGRVHAS
jgi:transcriptional regulator with XRE-family HTH domain